MHRFGGGAIGLFLLLGAGVSFCGQQDPTPEQAQTQASAKLKIVIVEGDGAINNIRQRVAREPIVQVTDENNNPVAGAAVVFMLPSSGASGTFPDGSRIATILTDENGRAVARGIRPNNLSGDFQIRVTASHQGSTASATITQTNAVMAAAGGGAAGGAAAGAGMSVATKIAIIVGIAAAGAAGATVAAKGGGGSSSSSPAPSPVGPTIPSATIGIGGVPVFGPPR